MTTKNSDVWYVAVAALLAAAAVVLCYSDVFFGAYLSKNFRPNPPAVWVIAMAGGAAVLAAAIALVWPRFRTGLVRVLAATAFVFLIYRPMAMPWSYWLSTLSLSRAEQYWVFRGPGGAIFGLLPSAIVVVLVGHYVFGVSVREQWNGRLRPSIRDLVYGGSAAALLSTVFLIGAAATGNGRVAWEPNWAGHGANLFSNLYEELLARGLLLQVCRRSGGNWFAIFWTAVVFGAMHPFGWFAVGVASTAWIIAWVILRSGSLWAGYFMHQGLDVFMDSLLH